MSSRIPGFHAQSAQDRLDEIATRTNLTDAETRTLQDALDAGGAVADHLSENVISTLSIPLGIATNMIVDGTDVLVPMATEESSVVAAVCNGAKACRAAGGITTQLDPPRMIAQVQIKDVPDMAAAKTAIAEARDEIISKCNDVDPMLRSIGGGCREIECHGRGPYLVVHLIVDVRDAMGANAVNSMAEMLAPDMERLTGGTVGLKILSNLADRRLARASAIWKASEIGESVVAGIIGAYDFAVHDPYRAATHNKGVMNGISAVALASGNDTRAIEAGAHAYAAQNGYGPLTRYSRTEDGDLLGEIELPMAVGIVGGATKAHPTAQICLKIMGADSGARLASVIAATGLVQNFSALRALATEGIQKGHMSLHARNVAIAAGASGDQIDQIARAMVDQGRVREDIALALMDERNDRSG